MRGDWLGLIRSGLAIPGSGSGRSAEPGSTTSLPSSAEPAGFSTSMALTDMIPGRLERDNDFGFAIPVRDVLWVADQLRAHGRVDRAYLGVRVQPGSAAELPAQSQSLTEAAAKSEPGTVDSEGAILHEVLAGTPAAAAGLRPGDTIVALDGRAIRSTHDLTDRLDRIPARTTIVLSVIRGLGPGQQRISLSVQTASRPDPPRLASQAPASIPITQRSTNMPRAVTATLTVSTAPTTPDDSLIASPTFGPGPFSRPSKVAFTVPASKPKPPLQNRAESPSHGDPAQRVAANLASRGRRAARAA